MKRAGTTWGRLARPRRSSLGSFALAQVNLENQQMRLVHDVHPERVRWHIGRTVLKSSEGRRWRLWWWTGGQRGPPDRSAATQSHAQQILNPPPSCILTPFFCNLSPTSSSAASGRPGLPSAPRAHHFPQLP